MRSLIVYNYNVKTLDDIKKDFPKLNDIYMKRIAMKPVFTRLLKEEEERAEIDAEYDKWLDVCNGEPQKLNEDELKAAKQLGYLRAIYRILWCEEHIADQLFSAIGWKENKNILFKRMKKAGLDPYSTESDTIYDFIETVKGGGFVFKTVKERTFKCFDPYAPIETEDERRSRILDD